MHTFVCIHRLQCTHSGWIMTINKHYELFKVYDPLPFTQGGVYPTTMFGSSAILFVGSPRVSTLDGLAVGKVLDQVPQSKRQCSHALHGIDVKLFPWERFPHLLTGWTHCHMSISLFCPGLENAHLWHQPTWYDWRLCGALRAKNGRGQGIKEAAGKWALVFRMRTLYLNSGFIVSCLYDLNH